VNRLCIDFEENSIGVAQNKGLELLVIEKAFNKNINLTYKKKEETNA
jgi:hypothetical protein